MGYFGNPKILIGNSHLWTCFEIKISKVDFGDHFGNSHSVARGRFCHEKSKQMFKTHIFQLAPHAQVPKGGLQFGNNPLKMT